MKIRRILAILLLSVLSSPFLIQCGSSTPNEQSNNTSALNSCLLMTKADVESVIGGTVSDPQAGPLDNQGDGTYAFVSNCVYTSTPSNIKVDLVTRQATSGNKNDPAGDKAKLASLYQSTPQDVSGVGDSAFSITSGPSFAHAFQLIVYKGIDLQLDITIFNLTDDTAALNKAKSLAQTVLSRL